MEELIMNKSIITLLSFFSFAFVGTAIADNIDDKDQRREAALALFRHQNAKMAEKLSLLTLEEREAAQTKARKQNRKLSRKAQDANGRKEQGTKNEK